VPELIKGSGGAFEVRADGALVFSKKQAGRFPEAAEVLAALAPRDG
jgi:selenoprotein W-related protein